MITMNAFIRAKRTALTLATLLLAAALAGCGASAVEDPASDKLQVCASFYTMADFAAKVGGERVDIHNLVPAGAEPHDWEPTTQDMARLEKADLLIVNGAGFEQWVGTVVPALQNKSLAVVETAAAVPLQDSDGDDGHGHSAEDPHVWLSPVCAKAQLSAIRDALVAADPDGTAVYDENLARYTGELDALDQRFRDTLSPLPNKEIVVAHQAFGYLCHEYDLTQVSVQGLSPDGEPDPAQMADVINYAKTHHVRVVFFEELTSPKVAETIAREIGADTAVLNPLEGLSDDQLAAGEDYFSIMEQNLAGLKVALE